MPEEIQQTALPAWEHVSDNFRQAYPDLNQDALRTRYEQARQLSERRQHYQGATEDEWAWWARRSVPFGSVAANVNRDIAYGRARSRMTAGTPEPADADLMAAYEELQHQDQTASTGRQVLGGLASIPALVGEGFVGGRIIRGAAEAAPRALGWLAPRAVQAGGGEAASLLARAGGGEAGSLLSQTAAAAARAVPQTALTPSMYLQQATQRNIAEGRDPTDIRGLPPALALGSLQTTVLGSLGHFANDVPGTRLGPYLERLARRTGAGMAEQAGIDVLAGMTGLQSGYGLVGDLMEGDTGHAFQHAIVQAATFAAFAGLHEREGRDPIRDRFLETTRELRRQGMSREAAGQRLQELHTVMGEALAANPGLTRQEAQDFFRNTPEGPLRRYADTLAEFVPGIRHSQSAGPEPGMERPDGTVLDEQARQLVGQGRQQAQEASPGHPEVQTATGPTPTPPVAPEAPPARVEPMRPQEVPTSNSRSPANVAERQTWQHTGTTFAEHPEGGASFAGRNGRQYRIVGDLSEAPEHVRSHEGQQRARLRVLDESGSEAGHVDFYQRPDGAWEGEGLRVEDGHREKGGNRTGVAGAMYDYMNHLGETVVPNEGRTPDGKSFWRRNREYAQQRAAEQERSIPPEVVRPQIAPEAAPGRPEPQAAPEPAPTPPVAPQAPPVRAEATPEQRQAELEHLVATQGSNRGSRSGASDNVIPADVEQRIDAAGLDHRQARAFKAFLQTSTLTAAGKSLGVSRQAATKSVNNALARLREIDPETWGRFRNAREVLDRLGESGLESLSRRSGGEARAGELPDVPDRSVENLLSSSYEDSPQHIGNIRDGIDRLVVMADRLEKDPHQHVLESMPEMVRRFGEQQTREIITAAVEAFRAEHPEYRRPIEPSPVRPEVVGGVQREPEVRPPAAAGEGGGGLQGAAPRQGGEGAAETPGRPEVPETGAGGSGAAGRDELREFFASLEERLSPGMTEVSLADLREASGMGKEEFENTIQEMRRDRQLRLVAAGDPATYADPRTQDSMIRGEGEVFTHVERGSNYPSELSPGERQEFHDAARQAGVDPEVAASALTEAERQGGVEGGQQAVEAVRVQAFADAAKAEAVARRESRLARQRLAQSRRQLREREVGPSAPGPDAPRIAGSFERPEPRPDPVIELARRLGTEEGGYLDLQQLLESMGAKATELKGKAGTFRQWLRELWGATAPRTSAVSPLAGNTIAEYNAAHTTARLQAPVMQEQVLGKNSPPEQATLLGQTYLELRLRHMRLAYRQRAAEASQAAADARAQGRQAEATRQAALSTESMNAAIDIGSMVGGQRSVLKTEADFQRMIGNMPLGTVAEVRAALEAPLLKETTQRYRQNMVPEMERNFRDALGMEETDRIDSFTQIEGFPINLHRLQSGEPVTPGTAFVGGGRGNLANVRNTKLGLAKRATGAGTGYETNLATIIEQTLAKGIRAATKNKMLRTLLEQGVAVRARPGEHPEIDGQPTEKIDGVFRSEPAWGSPDDVGRENLHLAEGPYQEVRRALAPDKPAGPALEAVRQSFSYATRATLAGLGEALGHAGNMAMSFFRPGMSLVDFFRHAAGLMHGDNAANARLVELSKIGAMKDTTGLESGLLWGGKTDPTSYVGRFVDFLQRSMRLTMDSAFSKLAESGRVQDTVENRRDFINRHLGNYNKKSGSALVAWLKDTGVGPFAVAATTNLGSSLRALTANPGVRATSFGQALGLRAEMLGRMAVFAALAPLVNYLAWGKAEGDDNTPFGDIRLGTTAEGRTIYLPWLSLTGLNRGARASGLSAVASGIQNTSTPGQMLSGVVHNAAVGALSPAAGPALQFGHTALTGQNYAGHNIAQTPGPEGSVAVNRLGAALANANPAVASLTGLNNPGRDQPASERLLGMMGPRGPHFRSEVERLQERYHVVAEQRRQFEERSRQGQAFPREAEYATLHAFTQAIRQLEDAHAGRGRAGGRVGQGPVPGEEQQRQFRLQQVSLAREALRQLSRLR